MNSDIDKKFSRMGVKLPKGVPIDDSITKFFYKVLYRMPRESTTISYSTHLTTTGTENGYY